MGWPNADAVLLRPGVARRAAPALVVRRIDPVTSAHGEVGHHAGSTAVSRRSGVTAAPITDQTGPPVEGACRVLVVDDRQERRAVMRTVLESGPVGLRVVAEAGTVATALDSALRHSPDAVVVEVQMPVAAGLAVIEGLRAQHPSVVIVACSFHVDASTQRAALDAGADVYLTKPVAALDLRRACRAHHPDTGTADTAATAHTG